MALRPEGFLMSEADCIHMHTHFFMRVGISY